MAKIVPARFIDGLRKIDTPTLCTAIEKLQYRLLNEGYMNAGIVSRTAFSHSMVGHALTLQMRTANPPIRGRVYEDNEDWWDRVLSIPTPRIAVIQDKDDPPGIGAVAGFVHGTIFKRLGCIGIITNGAIRNLPFMQENQMHIYSGSVSPSHAYSHIVGVGQPIEVAGLTVKPGDLLHGDAHGIVSIPTALVKDLLSIADKILQEEKSLSDFCRSNDLSLSDLRKLVTTLG